MFIENSDGDHSGGEDWVFILYIAGRSPNSVNAIQNLGEIAEEYLPGRYHIQIIDAFEKQAEALQAGIHVLPTLVKLSPGPRTEIIGSLSDKDKVLPALGLVGA